MTTMLRRAATIIIAAFALTGVFATGAAADLRGWHADGQTWLVWDTWGADPFTYDLYVSDAPFTELAAATLAGRLLPEDWNAARLKLAKKTATWRVPDGNGAYYTLKNDEGAFAWTPHEAAPAYFAVVKHGDTAIDPANIVGPIAQTLDPVECHAQLTTTGPEGAIYTVYALWVDGRADWDSGREDFPVMANEHGNGVAHMFAVHEPREGRPGAPMAAVIALHGGGPVSNYINFGNGLNFLLAIDTHVSDGLLVALDDAMWVRKDENGEKTLQETLRWLGYWSGYNRFEVPAQTPPDDGIVVDYSLRRVEFIFDWLLANEDIDPHRVSLLGMSGGGGGVHFIVKRRPWAIAAGTSLSGPYIGSPIDFANYLQGDIDQDLYTNIEGMRLSEWYWPTNLLYPESDMPFLRFCAGRNDEFESWDSRVVGYGEIHDLRWGSHLYWDERDHVFHWFGNYWVGTPRHSAQILTRYRNDRSFPAIAYDDLDIATPGRQPEMGDGSKDSGAMVGTWGGYIDWDTEDITDAADSWAATLFLVTDSDFENDNAPVNVIRADVSIRRPQSFRPAPGAMVTWRLVRPSDKVVLDVGIAKVRDDGLVTAKQVDIDRDGTRLEFFADAPPDGVDDDTGDDDEANDDDTDANDDADADADEDDDDDDDDGGSGCGC
ncbi:hypothetical protein K8I61_08875 [bacterium]|nr:hypothetical protein [bacterium]